MVVHSYHLSTWEMVAEDQAFKVILSYRASSQMRYRTIWTEEMAESSASSNPQDPHKQLGMVSRA